MSAPTIPNLLSLRGKRGGSVRPRRGAAAAGARCTSSTSPPNPDAAVQTTDHDAATSRLSAVQLGYLTDAFAPIFSPPSSSTQQQQQQQQHCTRRLPIINRGTYVRTSSLDRLVGLFLAHGDEHATKQVISLGAGSDTRALRLLLARAAHQHPCGARLVYHELDFASVCTAKLRAVLSSARARDLFETPPVPTEASSWHAVTPARDELWCHGVDLRSLARTGGGDGVVIGIDLPGLRDDVPTLLLSECCLCYLSPSDARGVLSYFLTSRLAAAPGRGVVVYETTRPNDAFGRVMAANLAARGLQMPTVAAYPEPADQEARLRDALGGGHDVSVRVRTVGDVWGSEGWVGAEERERVDALEGLDEVEEWDLLAAHYLVAWAWHGSGFDGFDGGGL